MKTLACFLGALAAAFAAPEDRAVAEWTLYMGGQVTLAGNRLLVKDVSWLTSWVLN